jgi:putative inorganic carbon (hco3(-)) transporter
MQLQPLIRPARPAADRAVFVLLLVLLAWLPLPWGSKPPAAAAMFGLAVWALVIARLAVARRRLALPDLPGAARVVMGLALAWLGWGALYLIPLPAGLLEALSASAHAAHAAVATVPPGRAAFTLSLAPAATVDALVAGANYLGLFWLVLVTIARNRWRQRVLLAVLLFAGVGQALYGAVMTLSGFEYGFFEPKTFGVGWATGTFVNRNHLAGYLELTLAAGIALVLADLRPTDHRNWRQTLAELIDLILSPRMRARVMIAVMVIALVLTRSRMGNVAFFVALAVSGNLYILLRHRRHFAKSLLFFASLFLVDLLIVSEQYGLEKVAQRLESTDLATEERTLAFRDLLPAIGEYAALGSGPGTFAAAFSPHRSADLRGFYDHAHNDYGELLVETGVVGVALLGAAAGTAWIHGFLILRRRRDPMAAALAFAGTMALLALGLHSLADFNLHIPAVAATLVTLVAAMLSCSSHPTQPGAGELGPGSPSPQQVGGQTV